MTRLRITGPGRPRKDTTFLSPGQIWKLEADRERMDARIKRHREAGFELLGGVCMVCGTHDYLDTHHRRGTEKLFSLAGHWSRSWETLVPELLKCDLLCRVCHIERHVHLGDESAARMLRKDWQRFLFNAQPIGA